MRSTGCVSGTTFPLTVSGGPTAVNVTMPFGYTRSAIQAVFDATGVENAQKILGKTAIEVFNLR
jgi:hypothetical protein